MSSCGQCLFSYLESFRVPLTLELWILVTLVTELCQYRHFDSLQGARRKSKPCLYRGAGAVKRGFSWLLKNLTQIIIRLPLEPFLTNKIVSTSHEKPTSRSIIGARVLPNFPLVCSVFEPSSFIACCLESLICFSWELLLSPNRSGNRVKKAQTRLNVVKIELHSFVVRTFSFRCHPKAKLNLTCSYCRC